MSHTGTSKARRLAVLLLILTLSLVSGKAALEEKLPLRILYVGCPGAERTSDFVAFLKAHFQQVDTADLKRIELKQKLEADVVLLDYDGDGFKAPRLTFPDGYSQPTLTIGVAGAMICSQNRLKTGYL